jgi:voltage-gated potassium channel
MQLRDRYNHFIAYHAIAWELTFAALAVVYVVVGFLADDPGSASRQAVEVLETGLTVIFVLEFATRFLASRNRARYLVDHLVDLVALIPTARGLRLFRLLRLLRLVRAFSGLFRALSEVQRIAAHRALVGLVVAWLAVMVICSIAFYAVEHETNDRLRSPMDALWWGIATLTGGDPLVTITTLEGRVAAGVLLVVGVGLFGAITAVITTQLLSRAPRTAIATEHDAHRDEDLPGLIRELVALHRDRVPADNEYESTKGRAPREAVMDRVLAYSFFVAAGIGLAVLYQRRRSR